MIDSSFNFAPADGKLTPGLRGPTCIELQDLSDTEEPATVTIPLINFDDVSGKIQKQRCF